MHDVRFGSKADVARSQADVRFTTKSGHPGGAKLARRATADLPCPTRLIVPSLGPPRFQTISSAAREQIFGRGYAGFHRTGK
jgi:hypothetical protein